MSGTAHDREEAVQLRDAFATRLLRHAVPLASWTPGGAAHNLTRSEAEWIADDLLALIPRFLAPTIYEVVGTEAGATPADFERGVRAALARYLAPEVGLREAQYVTEYQVHEAQARDGDWITVPVKDEAEGRAWLEAWDRGGVVIRARVVRLDRTVLATYVRAALERNPE